MSTSAAAVFALCFVFAAVSIAFYLWARRTGQFEDVEGIKHRMLDDE